MASANDKIISKQKIYNYEKTFKRLLKGICYIQC